MAIRLELVVMKMPYIDGNHAFFNCHLFYIRTEREVEKGRVRGRQRKRRVNGGTSDSVSCLVELAIWGHKAHGA